jgi:limonene-1,2-epoxide hydrolase
MDSAEIVHRCFDAMHAKDVDGVMACFHDNAEFWPLPDQHLVGKDAIRGLFEQYLGHVTENRIDILRELSVGNLFFNERTDYLVIGDQTIDMIGCGVFELQDGLIRYWRDYFYNRADVADLD